MKLYGCLIWALFSSTPALHAQAGDTAIRADTSYWTELGSHDGLAVHASGGTSGDPLRLSIENQGLADVRARWRLRWHFTDGVVVDDEPTSIELDSGDFATGSAPGLTRELPREGVLRHVELVDLDVAVTGNGPPSEFGSTYSARELFEPDGGRLRYDASGGSFDSLNWDALSDSVQLEHSASLSRWQESVRQSGPAPGAGRLTYEQVQLVEQSMRMQAELIDDAAELMLDFNARSMDRTLEAAHLMAEARGDQALSAEAHARALTEQAARKLELRDLYARLAHVSEYLRQFQVRLRHHVYEPSREDLVGFDVAALDLACGDAPFEGGSTLRWRADTAPILPASAVAGADAASRRFRQRFDGALKHLLGRTHQLLRDAPYFERVDWPAWAVELRGSLSSGSMHRVSAGALVYSRARGGWVSAQRGAVRTDAIAGRSGTTLTKILDTDVLPSRDPEARCTVTATADGTVYVAKEDAIFTVTREVELASEIPDLRSITAVGPGLVALDGRALSGVSASSEMGRLRLVLGSVSIAGDQNTVFVAGSGRGASPSLYEVHLQDSQYRQLLDLPQLPDTLAARDGRVYFSIGPMLFSAAPGEPLVQEAVLLGFERLTSIAVGDDGIVYLSDGKALYALVRDAEPRLVLVLADMGGQVVAAAGDVYVLSTDLRGLYRLQGVSRAVRGSDGTTLSLMRELRGQR